MIQIYAPLVFSLNQPIWRTFPHGILTPLDDLDCRLSSPIDFSKATMETPLEPEEISVCRP